ncbi:uncharacterized protein E0L32_000608 [Thyridium curvatum]|uniref:Uncharacterized protein n=1 Tax=Thyridium curvatum TaxID=1093900 RepID=A0A507B667_9PEZI|nr:uncharacterized protein E0L32_000608 [Thyridium curvatum]TPX14214.1 hypothetical protein E0L32_000608 [Thyridium curvatum]
MTTARMTSSRVHQLPGKLLVAELFFEVPLDYADPTGPKIQLFARAATRYERPIVPAYAGTPAEAGFARVFDGKRPWLAYLEGGPGVGHREPQDHPLTNPLLDRGYDVLYLDYRGTGMSTPISAASLRRVAAAAQAQADYVKHFRADNNVRDCEAVRRCLTADLAAPRGDGDGEDRRKWSTFGQSYGGFVTLTYLSLAPEGLRECFMTGGLAPLGRTAEQVYAQTYGRVDERNAAYFSKYPEDVDTLSRLSSHILREHGGAIPLPAGGRLTVRRLFTLGQTFGAHGGLDAVHALLLRMRADLDQHGLIARPALSAFERFLAYDDCPFYAFMQEVIYCYGPGVSSDWAADRVGRTLDRYRWLSDPAAAADPAQYPLHFAGEMMYPFMFDDYPELRELREVADILARHDGWPRLYDEARLARNEVPVYAASFDDMYVDMEFAREVARKVKGIRVLETNVMYHNALRSKTDELLAQIFKLRDDVID